MRTGLCWIHAGASWLLVAAILVQVFLAGAAIANLGGSGDFRTHVAFGYSAVGIVALGVLLTALAARADRRDAGVALGLLALYVVQTTLPSFRASLPAVAALHPVNAVLLFALSTWYARHAWAAARESRASQAGSEDLFEESAGA